MWLQATAVAATSHSSRCSSRCSEPPVYCQSVRHPGCEIRKLDSFGSMGLQASAAAATGAHAASRTWSGIGSSRCHGTWPHHGRKLRDSLGSTATERPCAAHCNWTCNTGESPGPPALGRATCAGACDPPWSMLIQLGFDVWRGSSCQSPDLLWSIGVDPCTNARTLHTLHTRTHGCSRDDLTTHPGACSLGAAHTAKFLASACRKRRCWLNSL